MPKHPCEPVFLIYFERAPPPLSGSSVPEWLEMSADDPLSFHSVGTVFICSRKEWSKHTNTDACSWIFINRNNSCRLVAPLSARGGGASTHFSFCHVGPCLPGLFQSPDRSSVNLYSGCNLSNYVKFWQLWVSFCPFQNHKQFLVARP